MLIFLMSLIHSAYSELVRMDFEVKDVDGKPIAGAVIRISTSKRLTLPYQKPEKKNFLCTTGKDGAVTERFFCWDGCVNCYVSADGFYSEDIKDIFFKSNFNRETGRTEFSEDCKKVTVQLKPVKVPIPMFAYRPSGKRWLLGEVEKNTCVGFDLMKGDWLPPRGNGELADFYVDHSVAVTNGIRSCTARLSFPPGGGAYIVKGVRNSSHQIVYCADTSMAHQTVLQSSECRSRNEKIYSAQNNLLARDDTLVIRCRVVRDAQGNVVSENYAKIYGPMSIAGVFEIGQICFNPNVNDTNLEFDTHKNLADKNIGTFYP